MIQVYVFSAVFLLCFFRLECNRLKVSVTREEDDSVGFGDLGVMGYNPKCTNGVCCPEFCRICTGPDCGSGRGELEDCCRSSIEGLNRHCDEYYAPCEYDEDDFGPICTSEVCCHPGCGKCGGTGCSARIGGKEHCCVHAILETAAQCERKNTAFPCVKPFKTDPN